MGLLGTAIIYGIIGAVVATATALAADEKRGLARGVSFAMTALFWPVFAPFVLASSARRREVHGAELEPQPAQGEESASELRIRATEAQLVASLGKLDGVAEDILAPELARVHGLAVALRTMARRLVEMEALLATPEFSLERAEAALADLDTRHAKADDPRRRSVESRVRNIERLGVMRARTAENLERALLEMEEMSAQMMVLKFAGRPESEVVNLIKEIAASIEGVAEGLLDAA